MATIFSSRTREGAPAFAFLLDFVPVGLSGIDSSSREFHGQGDQNGLASANRPSRLCEAISALGQDPSRSKLSSALLTLEELAAALGIGE